jgi:hypothetical protein
LPSSTRATTKHINDAARAAIKQVLELPNDEADLIIRSLNQSAWTVSNKLRKTLPDIFDEAGQHYALHAHIVAGVREALEGGRGGDKSTQSDDTARAIALSQTRTE